jgi:hypothetical protein
LQQSHLNPQRKSLKNERGEVRELFFCLQVFSG